MSRIGNNKRNFLALKICKEKGIDVKANIVVSHINRVTGPEPSDEEKPAKRPHFDQEVNVIIIHSEITKNNYFKSKSWVNLMI